MASFLLPFVKLVFPKKMRNLTMKHYCRIDLVSNYHAVVIIDEEGKRVLNKRIGNDFTMTLSLFSP
jgi:hypothetical protein